MKSRSRILKSSQHPMDFPALDKHLGNGTIAVGGEVDIAEKYAKLDQWFQRLENRRVQELTVSWAVGCFSAILVVMAARFQFSASIMASRGAYVAAPQTCQQTFQDPEPG